MIGKPQPDGTLADDIRELLIAGQQQAHVVIMLTDEELAALTNDQLQESTPHPWLDAQTDAAADLADARAVTVLAGVSASPEGAGQRRLTVYALSDRTEVVQGDTDALTATQVSRASLLDRMAALVGL